ncbi:TPA: hypothetical protein IAB95_01490 [Candidatus Ventrenecus avicola]|nr:hypothetical protein [Candidatus Ventrenecus avicola]
MNYQNKKEKSAITEEELLPLLSFPFLPETIQKGMLSNLVIQQEKNHYFFSYQKEKIPFQLFSDFPIQRVDKAFLQKKETANQNNFRLVKIFCSLNLPNSTLVMGSSDINDLYPLISYQDKIIDYQSNLVMNKRDYEKLFHLNIKSQLDRVDVYQIFITMKKLNDLKNPYKYFLNWEKIKKDLSKNHRFKYLSQKYDEYGVHYNNEALLGEYCDSMFLSEEDGICKYRNLRTALDNFTMHTKTLENQTIKYKIEEPELKTIEFAMISDILDSEEEKNILQSKERYSMCHSNAYKMAIEFFATEPKAVYVVAGMIEENELDKFFHSWVEVKYKNKTIVVDYNHNLIMEKNIYYKIYGAIPLEKTTLQELLTNFEWIEEKFGLPCSDFLLNYFSKEIVRDLQKNIFLLEKRRSSHE